MITVHVHVPIINSPMSNVPIMRMFNVARVPKSYKAPVFLEQLVAGLSDQGTVSLECKVPVVVIMIFPFYLVIESLSDN